MKIIDIRARHIPDEELLKDSHARFHLDIKEVSAQELKKIPPYEIEVGKKGNGGRWLKGLKQVSFSFITPIGFKRRFRVKASFILATLLLFVLFGVFHGIVKMFSLKDELLYAGRKALTNSSSQNLFAASLVVKQANKRLAILGEIPEFFSQRVKTLGLGSAWAEFFLRASGYYNPRYYLVLFQNNSEIRATGGFIGSYALLTAYQGEVDIKKVEGIFNVSGQQSIDVIPPEPIQKISRSWSMHDANWFFDFPTSAKAISWLYEKSGGPTVDGIIAITPELLQRLIRLTGPIELTNFGIVLDEENFMEILQYEVEVRYKERRLKDPKEILTHVTSLLVERLSHIPKDTLAPEILDALIKKEVLLWFSRPEEQAFVTYYNWGGGIIATEDDYLAVVNSNINGFKTDKMIVQTITHQSELSPDGSIIDTVTVQREHQGGKSAYEWYNKVNVNFLRIYVPKGSLLLDAKGHTLEFRDPPLDYQKAGFFEYPSLKKINEATKIDQKSGTRVFEEQNKTVFGNWVYVSPQKNVEVVYRYLLPFKLERKGGFYRYTLAVQKQPGITYQLTHQVQGGKLVWQSQTPSTISQDRIYASIISF